MNEFVLRNNYLNFTFKSLVWLRYIDGVFFIWTHGGKELHKFMEDLFNRQPSIKFTYTFSKNCVPFLNLKVQLLGPST